MTTARSIRHYTVQERIDALRAQKLEHTHEKQRLRGAMDTDDVALIVAPEAYRELVQGVDGSGVASTEVRLRGVQMESNHPSGGFFGPRIVGANFKRLLDAHPPYVDPMDSLAGAYMANFLSYVDVQWNPDVDYSHLKREQKLYNMRTGIGGMQHFCQDEQIGLDLGFGGLLAKVRHHRQLNPVKSDFYDGLESVVLGIQGWIQRTAEEARRMALVEAHPQLKRNLQEMAEINDRLVTEPPQTFREACQWMVWYQMAARSFNGSGSLGKLDLLLKPYYERDVAAGILSDEDAILHIAGLLLKDTAYMQLGGPDADGTDVTNRVSYLVLEAAHRLKIPCNVGVSVGPSVDPGLLRRGVEMLFEDKLGIPKFLGVDNTIAGFVRSGYPEELARLRAYSGCHWSALPGREFTRADGPKINLAAVFDAALHEMMADEGQTPSIERLWDLFDKHLTRSIEVMAEGLDIHMAHWHEMIPDLVLDLCCHGTMERGEDASHGGVDYVNLGIDAVALATTADSFAALEQRVAQEKRFTWQEMLGYIDSDWAGPQGQRARLAMSSIAHYGSGGSRADDYALRIAHLWNERMIAKPTPAGFKMIPGFFSWARTIFFGKSVGATPNGRHAGEPVSHGPNPHPGFRKDGAPTALATAVAAVQSPYGNTAPMQIELDPGLATEEEGVNFVVDLFKAHMDLGGTQINANIVDKAQVLEAHADPSRHPDLIVRVTGFSAYFSSLSPEFRQLVVDRIIAEM